MMTKAFAYQLERLAMFFHEEYGFAKHAQFGISKSKGPV